MKTPFKNHIIDYNSAICHHKMLPKVLPCKTKPGGGVFFVVQFFVGYTNSHPCENLHRGAPFFLGAQIHNITNSHFFGIDFLES